MEKIKLTDEKYINMYKNADDYCWVERRNNSGAVTIYPRYIDAVTGKEYALFIREYRPAIGRYLYSLPAGLIDSGETVEMTAFRELREETGAIASSVTFVAEGYTSAGLTTEYAIMVSALVTSFGELDLQDNEDITVIKVEKSEIAGFLAQHASDFCLRSMLLAMLMNK